MTDEELIAAAIKRLKKKEPVSEVLKGLLASARESVAPVERLVETNSCKSCGEPDALCFMCKTKEALGEQAVLAMPFVLPQLAKLAKDAMAAAVTRPRPQPEPHARPQAPPPPPGRQNF